MVSKQKINNLPNSKQLLEKKIKVENRNSETVIIKTIGMP